MAGVTLGAGDRLSARTRDGAALDADAALRTLRSHALDGVDRVLENAHERTTRIGDTIVTLRIEPSTDAVTTTVIAGTVPTRALRTHIDRWFDLDVDTAPINAHLSRDPLLAASVRARPGIRITRTVDPFEATTMAVVGQQISLTAARAMGGRFVHAYGAEAGEGRVAFPTPDATARADVPSLREVLRVPLARAQTVHDVAALFAGGFRLEAPGALTELESLRGIGPWTIGYLRVRCLGDPDAFPASDIVLRRAVNRESAAALTARARAWSPWRSYAAVRLWEQAHGRAVTHGDSGRSSSPTGKATE